MFDTDVLAVSLFGVNFAVTVSVAPPARAAGDAGAVVRENCASAGLPNANVAAALPLLTSVSVSFGAATLIFCVPKSAVVAEPVSNASVAPRGVTVTGTLPDGFAGSF